MNVLKSVFFFCLVLPVFLTAQSKQITLEEIWGGAFRTEGLSALHHMKDGQHYTVLNYDRTMGGTTVDVYDYKTLSKVSTVANSNGITSIDYFTDYTFSEDESQLLLATEEDYIYRYSKKGKYYVYSIKTGQTTLVASSKIQAPTFSPDGSKIAYALDNNLYIKNLLTGQTKQITFDGQLNRIINGITDWVYEEEFSFVRAFDWNATGNKIAFIRFDETDVPEFSMDIYGKELYQHQTVFKYPKAGEKNAKVSLHLYNLETDTLNEIVIGKEENQLYIPRLKWTKDENVLSAQYLNRHQNKLDLWLFDVDKHTAKLVLTETDKAYVDVTSDLTFLENNSFIWTSEKDGYKHIYHYDISGQLINQVTKGDWEVTEYYGYNDNTETVYYQSVENGSINRDVYFVKLNGTVKQRLTTEVGTNSADFSTDFSCFINTFSNANTPYRYTLNNTKTGKVIKSIKNNSSLKTRLADYKWSKKEFSTIRVNGNNLNIWLLKPANFDPSKQYPMLMYQYSGPGSQQVANTWGGANDYWYQMLAQQGYIVASVDGRGTGFKGADFKKVTQNQLGKYEVEDQISAAKILGQKPFIDASRIGIWGWSYGGFMSSNALFKGNDVFKMAIAVAPVTSWRFYDTIYTERFMTTPQENPTGYDDNSPIHHVDKLKGDFLLIHGTGDDNVHVQNTMRMVEALIQANKQFEWMIYPDKNHGIYGGNTRLHLYTKMTNFIHRTLGDKR